MYQGKITWWNDPAVAALNPGASLNEYAIAYSIQSSMDKAQDIQAVLYWRSPRATPPSTCRR